MGEIFQNTAFMYKYSWVHLSSFQWTLVFFFALEQQVNLTCNFTLNGYTIGTLAPVIQKVDKFIIQSEYCNIIGFPNTMHWIVIYPKIEQSGSGCYG